MCMICVTKERYAEIPGIREPGRRDRERSQNATVSEDSKKGVGNITNALIRA